MPSSATTTTTDRVAKAVACLVAFAVAGLGTAGVAGAVTPGFVASTAGSTGGDPVSVALGDLNGDGRPDLATANLLGNSVTVIMRNAAGTGWDPPVIAGSTGFGPVSVAIRDLNGDGKPDLATADNGANDVTVIMRNAAGTGWDPPVIAGSTGSHPSGLAVGDLNGDGRPDLATADQGGDDVTVITRDAAGTGWNPSTTVDAGSGTGPASLAIGDLNGDGRPDLATAGFKGNSVTVIARDAAGTGWDPPVTAGSTDLGPSSVAVADLNGDGRLDLATANLTGDVTVIARDAAGTGWDAPVTAGTTGAGGASVAVGDLNGDGRPDLVTANYSDNDVTVIARNAAGTGWDAPLTVGGIGRTPFSVAIGDLNGDGKPDLATANAGSNTVSVLTSDAVAPVTRDNVDGAVHSASVAVTLTAADTGGSSVQATYFTTGSTPATPTTASARYNPFAKPVLRNGERISYFSVDLAGNAEAVKTSRVARVTIPAPGPGVKVVRPFALTSLRSSRGTLALKLSVPAAGHVSIKATAKVTRKVRGKKRTATLTYATTGSRAVAAGTRTVTLPPWKRRAAQLREHRTLKLTVTVTYTRSGKAPTTIRKTITVKPPQKKTKRH